MTQLARDTLRPLPPGGYPAGSFHSLPALEAMGLGRVSRLPVSLRIVLESLLRNADGERVAEAQVRALAAWRPRQPRSEEIPFVVARIVAPDSSGVPLLADLAAMRDAAQRMDRPPGIVEPVVPVDLVVDHSLVVDRAGSADALLHNMQLEYRQNEERYRFLKWAAGAFKGVRIVPPGTGIIHQINVERLARGVWLRDGVYFPDTLVGTDSHTSMINGIGVLGWGVGGIEAEAGMLGQPVYFLTPDVVGVELAGALRPGVTATDLVLTVTETLRRAKVVGKFVEFFGEGAASLPTADRCTIANMAPEYGATAAYFPVDRNTLDYLAATGRTAQEVAALEAYFRAQDMFGMPRRGDLDYSDEIRIDLSAVVPSVAGPSRPQDRVALAGLKAHFGRLLATPVERGGLVRAQDKAADDGAATAAASPGTADAGATHAGAAGAADAAAPLRDGDIVLAAITSCTNTSNPGVLLAAGLLARKAVEKGLRTHPRVKTSFTPGSRVVDAYLAAAGLQPALDALGFQVVGHGCATCMGSSGPLPPAIEDDIVRNRRVAVAVLSGNRNFEARIHQAVRANFLMSPPLVVAFAIAGRIDFDPDTEPLGTGADGRPVYLRDVWPSPDEIAAAMPHAGNPEDFRRLYADFTEGDALWRALPAAAGERYAWEPQSTYLRRPPFFDDFQPEPRPLAPLRGARALAILGDSVTTDHINPAAAIKPELQAGAYLLSQGVAPADFNSYIARRSNHEVMMRGAFAHVRLRNLMVPGTEGGYTLHQPDGARMTIYDAAMAYARERVPLVVLAGEEYGTGSSRDWAAKGPALLGVRAVIARGFERIHRSNLVGMGILPCQFTGADGVAALGLDGSETFELPGIERGVAPGQALRLLIRRADGSQAEAEVLARIDTPIESTYFRHGGILPYMLRKLLDPNHEEAIA